MSDETQPDKAGALADQPEAMKDFLANLLIVNMELSIAITHALTALRTSVVPATLEIGASLQSAADLADQAFKETKELFQRVYPDVV